MIDGTQKYKAYISSIQTQKRPFSSLQVIPSYEVGFEFEPTRVEMIKGSTSAPNLLTEADLIALMDKHGIGNFI